MLKEWVSDFDSSSSKKRFKIINNESWVSQYAPKSVPDLAVHKAKILELETCLKEKLSGNFKSPIILITGPSGCGKTTTLNALCKELNIEVVEWLNPVVIDDYVKLDDSYDSRYTNLTYTGSQLTKFSDFLFRANRYSSLCFGSGKSCNKKLFIVKDFPNIFIQDPNKFYEIFNKYVQSSGAYPCVFIVTDSDQSSNIKRQLFPPNLLATLKVDVVKFNSIASTAMMKALTRIINGASSLKLKNFVPPSKEILEEIVETSNGDLRSACLSLEFICLRVKTSQRALPKTSKVKPIKKEAKKYVKNKRKSDEILEKTSFVGVKDSGMSLFRVLGKVLHCKRSEKMDPCESCLPDHLIHYSRNSLTFNPDEIYEKSCLSADTYCAFLHQNYPDFSNSLESVLLTSEYMSEADTLSGEWSVKSNMSCYQISLVTRGVSFSGGAGSTETSKKPGWMPLHKPQMYAVQMKLKENKDAILDSFRLFSSSINELSTVTLPYLNRLNLNPMSDNLSPQQIKQIKDINNFYTYNGKIKLERFDEKDSSNIGLPDEDEVQTEPFHYSSESTTTNIIHDSSSNVNGEEFFIEEID